MTRFLILFSVLLTVAMAFAATVLVQNGYSLLDPQMTPILLVVVLFAGYVSWRIDGILRRREKSRGGESGAGRLSAGFGFLGSKPSADQAARAARVAAKRKKLIAEGKLEPDPEGGKASEDDGPMRVSQSAPIKDRMAARAERVRRARQQGKI